MRYFGVLLEEEQDLEKDKQNDLEKSWSQGLHWRIGARRTDTFGVPPDFDDGEHRSQADHGHSLGPQAYSGRVR